MTRRPDANGTPDNAAALQSQRDSESKSKQAVNKWFEQLQKTKLK